MKKLRVPLLPKKGGLGVLALFLTLLLSCQSEIVAKPTVVEQTINEAVAQLADNSVASITPAPKTTDAVSLDDTKPKIDPELVKELKELKRQRKHKRVQVLVELKDEKALEAVKQAGGTVRQNFEIGNVAVVEVQSDKIEEISSAAGVEHISTEKEYVALLTDRIQAFSIDTIAWENNITGKDVKIAILDTGVGPHNSINVAKASSFVSGEDTADQNGHGTHVAGIAQGVAKDAAIYNAKVLNKNGAGTTSQIIAGINWAVEQNVDIISMSFGGMFTELDGPLASAVKEAMQHGVIFVAAAGNCKQGCGGFYGVTTPGNVKEVITVGAVDDNNVVTSFSSGDTFDGYIKPDITAPGVSITSAWLNNGQSTKSGTSMSTPFVAGVIALLLEKEPGLTNEKVKQKLEETATDAGSAGKDTSYGSGIINLTVLFDATIIPPTNNASEESNTAVDIAALPSDSGITLTPITVDCPENLAYSPALNITMQEFLTIYEYCTIPKDDTNETPQNLNPIVFFEPVEFLDPKSLPKKGILDAQYKAELQSKALSLQSVNFTELAQAQSIEELQAQANEEIDYDDIYTKSPSTADDGVAWMDGGTTNKNVTLEASNFQVICYDWCATSTFEPDHCFSTASTSALRQQDFNACSQNSSFVSSVCAAGKCSIGTKEGEHHIATQYIEKCTVKARYYKNCATPSFTYSSVFSAAHYTVKPRQYVCNSPAGTYNDKGLYDNSPTLWYDFIAGITCPSGKGCDIAKDENNADFGPSGTITPAPPCSKLDRQICASSSECMTSSHCTSGHCCPQGKIWTGSQCAGSSACDNDGLCESGETKANCPNDCNKPNGAVCTNNNQCASDYCNGQTGTCQAPPLGCNDADQDGYGSPGSASCSAGSPLTDCDNNNPFINPGAIEQCNGIDDDCDGQTDEGGVCPPQPTCNDQDQDGYGNPATGCPQTLTDCDDTKPNIHPNAPETCDGLDNDCDDAIDEANVCCGNQQCDTGLGETPQSCGQDCYTSYQITGIQAPITANQGQMLQVTASIKNTGTWPGSTNVEAAIIPDGWLPFNKAKCCSTNNFFGIKQTTIQPGQTNNLQFTLTAPRVTATDSCGGQSAWDTSHEISIGIYSGCGSTYQLKSTQNIKIQDKQCTKQSDCSLPLEKCVIPQGNTIGTCQANTCMSTCTIGQYSCSGETIRHCEDTNNDGCYEWKDTMVCPAGQTCISGQSTCATVQIATEATIEEASGGRVYKQVNDTVTLHLKYSQQEQISLNFQPSQFELDTTTCQHAFTITKDTACKFKVKTDVQGAELGIKKQNVIKSAKAIVVTTNTHNGIIITNKKKLYERFAGQENEVRNLLQEAYAFADKDYNKLIVYDLQELQVIHPWPNFPAYQETIANPFMVDNTLAIEIGKFIRTKCTPPQCQSTLILGDDYVVPHYRRYTQFLKSYWLSSAINTQLTYSEIPYVQRTSKEFSQLDEVLTDGGYAKPVMIILPDSLSTEMQTAVNKLKATLQKNFSSSITYKTSSTVTCNDPQLFNSLNGVTIIVIGTEQNNKAFNCMPFVAGLENRDAAFLEINPWDGSEHSIIINTENPTVIKTFSDALHTGAYKKILGRQWYFIEVGITVLSFASIACNTIGIPCDIITDGIDATIQCGVKQDTMLCGVSSTMLVVFYVPSGPVKLAIESFINYVGPAGGKFIAKYGPGAIKFMAQLGNKLDEFRIFLKKTADHFGSTWDDVIEKIAKSPEDEYAIAEGTRILEQKFGKNLNEFEPGIIARNNLYRAELLRRIGRYSKKFLEIGLEYSRQPALLRGIKGTNAERLQIFSKGIKAPNPSRSTVEDLIEHVTDSADTAFISTTTKKSVATNFATTNGNYDGWIYKIRSRSGQAIDMEHTPKIELAILQGNKKLDEWIKNEEIIGWFGDVDPRDIEGAWRVDKNGIIHEWYANPNFVGESSEVFGLP
ncbi:MAG: S8 family serine peptidase [Candidatus Woesearchaeota archaeon]